MNFNRVSVLCISFCFHIFLICPASCQEQATAVSHMGSEYFYSLINNIAGGPFFGDLMKKLTDQERERAGQVQLVVARRSAGLPKECLMPDQFAYSVRHSNAYEIVICSNNAMGFGEFVLEQSEILTYRADLIDNRVQQKYFRYFFKKVAREEFVNMGDYKKEIMWPCYYIEYYYIYIKNSDPDSCPSISDASGYAAWMTSLGAIRSPDNIKLMRKILTKYSVPDVDKFSDSQLYAPFRDVMTNDAISLMTQSAIAHELGHIVHGDIISDFDTCKGPMREADADKFAQEKLILMGLIKNSDEFYANISFWSAYASILSITIEEMKNKGDLSSVNTGLNASNDIQKARMMQGFHEVLLFMRNSKKEFWPLDALLKSGAPASQSIDVEFTKAFDNWKTAYMPELEKCAMAH